MCPKGEKNPTSTLSVTTAAIVILLSGLAGAAGQPSGAIGEPQDPDQARPGLNESPLGPEGPSEPGLTGLRAMDAGLEDRRELWREVLDPSSGPLSDRQDRNLALAEEMVATSGTDGSRSLEQIVALAQRATRDHAATLAPDWAASETSRHGSPSEAIHALLDRHGHTPDASQARAIAGYDDVRAPLRAAVTDVVDAFIALETATETMDAELGQIGGFDQRPGQRVGTAASGHHPTGPRAALATTAVDPAPVLAARNTLLDAVLGLEEAVEASPPGSNDAPDLELPPVLAVDLDEDEDNLYTEDVALLLDAGGDDVYHNNAGGAGDGAAALLDLGTGMDTYGDPESPRSVGANGGGGPDGVGVLVDDGGHDRYTAGGGGTNGGGCGGVGFLLDRGGDDRYTAQDCGTNGGASGTPGVGFLLDAAGNDTFTAEGSGTNGGAIYAGANGFLLDLEGRDVFTAESRGTNGGGYLSGDGALLDADGNDTYNAGSLGANGGASRGGEGFLVDGGGSDAYRAGDHGTNGGTTPDPGSCCVDQQILWLVFEHETEGFLLDASGDDVYRAGHGGTNGGGVLGVVGLLFDGQGTDVYEDPLVPGQRCTDCTLAPKGVAGAQVDSDDPPLRTV